MEINYLFIACVVPAIILYGIAKSGLGGSVSLISVPLMTIVMPLNQALAIILPILIFSDFIAIYRFRKEFDLSTIKLIPIDIDKGELPLYVDVMVEDRSSLMSFCRGKWSSGERGVLCRCCGNFVSRYS